MTVNSATYTDRRGQIEDYFDRTAVKAWEQLTSDAPVGRIRTTVRAGRDKMRATLLSWLPEDLHGRRVLDAGCGTGALAVEAARRGADVVAIDLSPKLVELARQRAPQSFPNGGSLDRLFPRKDRAPWLEPMAKEKLLQLMGADAVLAGWQHSQDQRISSGFYKSQAMEWKRL